MLFNFFGKKGLKLAICTMARKENLYIKEYVDYEHIYIFDDNKIEEENITEVINKNYYKTVTIYNYKQIIKDQKAAYTLCYEMNKDKYDWIFMNDIDEFLIIKNDTLKHYLSQGIFDKCDFIKIHWVVPTDNNLLKYDNRSLFERFKGPFLLDTHIKTLVRGNIKELQFDIHSPLFSPNNNISCNNKGEIFKNKDIFFQDVFDINIEKAYIIHFKYKSSEEYINKYKRGYKNWVGKDFLPMRISEYFKDNNISLEKIEYFERELNLNLSKLKNELFKRKKRK